MGGISTQFFSEAPRLRHSILDVIPPKPGFEKDSRRAKPDERKNGSMALLQYF